MYIQHARYGRPSSEVSSHILFQEIINSDRRSPANGAYRESKSGDSAVMERRNGLLCEPIPCPEVVCMIVRIVISRQLTIWLMTPNPHHPCCRPSCRHHSDALLSVTAFQSHHLLHWPWFCFIGYLSITILIIRAYSFWTLYPPMHNLCPMFVINHRISSWSPHIHICHRSLYPPRDLWSYLFNDETWLEHKYSKKNK